MPFIVAFRGRVSQIVTVVVANLGFLFDDADNSPYLGIM